MTWYPGQSATGGATDASLQQILTRLTTNDGNDNTRNTALIAKIQEIIDTRKPYQFVQCVDIRSYAIAVSDIRSDGKTTIEIADVFENGSPTGVNNVNWGLDNISAGNFFTYDAEFNGTHTITVLGASGRTFKRVFNSQKRTGTDQNPLVFYLTEDIFGNVDAQDYLRLTSADASGAVAVGDFDMQLNSYTPALPDTGKNKYLLHKAPENLSALQARQVEISGGASFTIPSNRINSIAVWTDNTGTDFDLSLDNGSTFINYSNSRPFGGFSAKEGYINQEIRIINNGSKIIIATLA
jgi:hypothetical protein